MSEAGKVKLTNVRLSFPTLWTPEQYEGAGPYKFRATFLFEPNSTNHKNLVKTVNELAKEEWKDKAAAVLKAAADDSKLRFIGNGDNKEYDGYAGMLYISATRDQEKGRPGIYDNKLGADGKVSPLVETDGKPYGGCYVNATVQLWPQNNKFGKTIRAQLLAVQFAKDGDAFGSGSSKGSPDDFEALDDVGDDSLVA